MFSALHRGCTNLTAQRWAVPTFAAELHADTRCISALLTMRINDLQERSSERATLAWLLLPYSFPQQGRASSMSDLDPHDRINLTGPWAGFGFQGGHMFTPEGHHLEPADMVWWSLTCNIAREWRLMMEEARTRPARSAATGNGSAAKGSSVICLRDALRRRRERRLGVGDPGPTAEPSNVVHMRRGPRPITRG